MCWGLECGNPGSNLHADTMLSSYCLLMANLPLRAIVRINVIFLGEGGERESPCSNQELTGVEEQDYKVINIACRTNLLCDAFSKPSILTGGPGRMGQRTGSVTISRARARAISFFEIPLSELAVPGTTYAMAGFCVCFVQCVFLSPLFSVVLCYLFHSSPPPPPRGSVTHA